MIPKLWMITLAAGLAAAAVGCKEREWAAPAAPTGVYSVTGDHRVDIYWSRSPDPGVRGYNVYWAPGSGGGQGPYKRLGSTVQTHWADTDVQNGVTTYYGVTAVNDAGVESELSAEDVHDTPRPEGYALKMYNSYYDSTRGGLYQSRNGIRFADPAPELQSWTDPRTDIFFNGTPGALYLWTGDDSTLILDMGTSSSLADVDFAPANGWTTDYRVPLLVRHTYCVWTRDDHFAKIFIEDVTSDWVSFDWAYQVAPGNRELKPVPPAGSAPRARPRG